MPTLRDIHVEDCIATMSKMDAGSIDLVVTSPPYDNLRKYNGFQFDFEKVASGLFRVLKEGGVIVWVVSDAMVDGSETGTSFEQALFFKKLGLNLHDTMIYAVNGTGAKGSKYAYWQSFEYMFVFSKGRPKTVNRITDVINKAGGKKRSSSTSKKLKAESSRVEGKDRFNPYRSVRPNVWTYNPGNNAPSSHPAVFPIELAKDHIHTWSNKGDIVYDPFMGSGTTALASEIMGRRWIGSEVSTKYRDEAMGKINAEIAQLKMFK